ncbi:ribonuclease H-like domain-containing protein [Tanacetum coccineum]
MGGYPTNGNGPVKYNLDELFEDSTVSNTDGIHKGYERFRSLLSQLESWSRNKPGMDSLSFDDLYNNLRVFENDVKGSTASSSNLQNVAFVSENTSSTNDVSTAYGVSNTSGHNSKHEQTSSYSLLASQSSCPQLDHEDLDQVDEYDLEEMDLKWQVAMISMRIKKFYKKTGRKLQFDAKEPVGFDKTKVECYNCHKTGHFARECRTKEDNRRRDGWNPGNKDGSRTGKKEESKALVTVDGESVDWTTHSEDDENYAFMASNSSGSDTQVTSCSNECKESYANLKRLYDAQREQLSDASVEIKAYTQGLKKVEAQLVAHQQGQLWYEQKIKFMKIDLDDKTDVLTYHKKLLAKAQKEKDDLEVIVDKWNHSSKNLGKIVNHHMSARDKFGLGYGDYRYSGILSYENEVLQSVFKSNKSDFENPPLHKRLVKTCEMQAVPPPMTGNYLPSGPDIEIDDSQYTYGPEKTQPSESESQTTELDTCNSNISTEPSELVSEPVVNESNIEVQPKVWSDAPIIEEYESDSDDECVTVQTKGLDTPSFANKQVKTPRENVKNQSTHSQKPKVNNKELGHGFTERACFVCGSFSHLIRDCNYHVKLAKQVELNKQNMSKGNGTRVRKPTWNNVQRVNKQNQFVPLAVQTRTGITPVNTAKASSTNNFSTARQNVNRETVKEVSTVRVNWDTAVKSSAGCVWRTKGYNNNILSKYRVPRQVVIETTKTQRAQYFPHRALQNKGIVDSGCSRHMTGNKAYLAEYQDFNGGPVAFWSIKVNITRVLVTKPHNKTPYELITGKGPTWLFDLDYLTDSMNYQPVRSENQANKHAGPQEANLNAGTEDIIDVGDSEKEAESAQDCFVLPIWSSYSSIINPDLKTDEKPVDKEEQVFLDELKRLKRQEKDANDEAEALRKEFAQETENLLIQAGAAKASSTNKVNTVSTPVSTASPYVGLSLSDPTNPEQDDSEIPALEDIYQNPTYGIFTNSSYDDEVAGMIQQFETVVNVSPIPTSRINSFHPSALILGDPNSAVQTRIQDSECLILVDVALREEAIGTK